jgi:hypothetical protein
MTLRRLFTEHPDAVGALAMAAGAALVHAFLPFLCQTTASRIVKALYARVTARRPRPGAAAAAASDRLLGWDPVI